MYVKLNGEMVYLWRAVDHEGEILESYVNRTRDKDAALTFIKKAPKRHGSPAMLRFRQMKSLQKFASVHANFHKHINQERHLASRQEYKTKRSAALAEWQSLMAKALGHLWIKTSTRYGFALN